MIKRIPEQPVNVPLRPGIPTGGRNALGVKQGREIIEGILEGIKFIEDKPKILFSFRIDRRRLGFQAINISNGRPEEWDTLGSLILIYPLHIIRKFHRMSLVPYDELIEHHFVIVMTVPKYLLPCFIKMKNESSILDHGCDPVEVQDIAAQPVRIFKNEVLHVVLLGQVERGVEIFPILLICRLDDHERAHDMKLIAVYVIIPILELVFERDAIFLADMRYTVKEECRLAAQGGRLLQAECYIGGIKLHAYI